jgi:hypothetical protein
VPPIASRDSKIKKSSSGSRCRSRQAAPMPDRPAPTMMTDLAWFDRPVVLPACSVFITLMLQLPNLGRRLAPGSQFVALPSLPLFASRYVLLSPTPVRRPEM